MGDILRIMNSWILIFPAVLIAFCLSCRVPQFTRSDSPSPDSTKTEEIAKNFYIWESRGIEDYDFVLKPSCFCKLGAVPAKIEVRDGNLSAIKPVKVSGMDSSGFNADEFKDYATIELLFDKIKAELNQRSYKIVVKLDDKLGYPKELYFDRNKTTADDELRIQIEQFEIIND